MYSLKKSFNIRTFWIVVVVFVGLVGVDWAVATSSQGGTTPIADLADVLEVKGIDIHEGQYTIHKMSDGGWLIVQRQLPAGAASSGASVGFVTDDNSVAWTRQVQASVGATRVRIGGLGSCAVVEYDYDGCASSVLFDVEQNRAIELRNSKRRLFVGDSCRLVGISGRPRLAGSSVNEFVVDGVPTEVGWSRLVDDSLQPIRPVWQPDPGDDATIVSMGNESVFFVVGHGDGASSVLSYDVDNYALNWKQELAGLGILDWSFSAPNGSGVLQFQVMGQRDLVYIDAVSGVLVPLLLPHAAHCPSVMDGQFVNLALTIDVDPITRKRGWMVAVYDRTGEQVASVTVGRLAPYAHIEHSGGTIFVQGVRAGGDMDCTALIEMADIVSLGNSEMLPDRAHFIRGTWAPAKSYAADGTMIGLIPATGSELYVVKMASGDRGAGGEGE